MSLEYERTEDSLVGAVSWDLAVRMRGSGAEQRTADGCCIRTPALRGNVMAVRRELFKQLGGTIRHDTIRDAVLTCAQKPTRVSFNPYGTYGTDN